MLKLGSTIRFTIVLILVTISFLEAKAKADKLRCMWRDDPSTTMVIGWDQLSGNAPEICYGVIDGGADTDFYPDCHTDIEVLPFKGMNNHFARLSNLVPDTEYFFIIIDSEGTSKRFSFRTAPADPYRRLSIIAGGDSRNFRGARVRANRMVAKLQPDFVLFGGDMTGGDSNREWREWFNDWQNTINSNGRLIPIVAARGNHEYSNETIEKLFDIPTANVYYKLRFGGDLLEIYTLNSLIAAGGNQREWLQQSLIESRDIVKWKMAQYHYAIRPHTAKKSERNNQMEHWGHLFYEHQVNLVFESDAHVVKATWPVRPSRAPESEQGFIRDDVGGTVYVGEGCWGAPLRRNNDDKSWTRASGSFNQFKWVFVDREGIEVRTVVTDNVDEVADIPAHDRFTPPAGLDIWSPENGPVIYIPAQHAAIAMQGEAKGQLVKNGAVPINMAIAQATVRSGSPGQLNFNWSLENQLNSNLGVFLIQSINEAGEYATLAKINTDFQSKDFNINLQSTAAKEFRLVFSHPGRQSIVFPMEDPAVKQSSDSNIDPSLEQDMTAKAFNQMRPDPNSGYLRVRYRLEEASDVDIRLVEKGVSAPVLSSQYQNQRQGNYLKSIDMSDYPNGDYQLVISINKEIIQEISITK